MNFKHFYGLLRQIGAKPEDKELLVYEASGGITTSIYELYITQPKAYELLIEGLERMAAKIPQPADAETDKWRKRCIAVICSWIDLKGLQPKSRIEYSKKVASRSATGKEEVNFNKLTVSQLRNVYNSFCKQIKVEQNVSNYTKMLNYKPN
ncbi:MAG: hypothetical protein SNJ71_00040 [Bacteroidales bacterium]